MECRVTVDLGDDGCKLPDCLDFRLALCIPRLPLCIKLGGRFFLLGLEPRDCFRVGLTFGFEQGYSFLEFGLQGLDLGG